jgi:hypothetical protein
VFDLARFLRVGETREVGYGWQWWWLAPIAEEGGHRVRETKGYAIIMPCKLIYWNLVSTWDIFQVFNNVSFFSPRAVRWDLLIIYTHRSCTKELYKNKGQRTDKCLLYSLSKQKGDNTKPCSLAFIEEKCL